MKTKHLLLILLLALMMPLAAKAQNYVYTTNGFDDPYFFTDGIPSGWTKFNDYGTGTVASNGEKLVFTSTALGSLSGQNISMFGVKMNSLGTILRVVKIGFKLKPSAKTSSILFRVGYYLNNTFNEIGTIAANNPLFNSNDLHDPIQEVPFSFVTELPQGARVAFVMATSANNRKWYLDDLYVQDVVPTGLVAENVTHESADLSWDAMSGVSQWQLEYEVDGNNIWNSVVVLNNSYTLSGLEANRGYRFRVAVKKGNYISSYSLMQSFRTIRTPVTVGKGNPYEHGFDFPEEWDIRNYANYQYANDFNEWIYDGAHLSITNRENNGANTSNEYLDRRCAIYAFKSFTFTNTGTYNFRYYWKSRGESQHDYLRVALVPYNVEIKGLPLPYEGLSYNTLPDGWIALDGGSELCQTSTPTWIEENYQYTFNSSTLGTYKVVFIWVNDNNLTVINPPASVDDFSISDVSAYPPSDVRLTALSHNAASITWNHDSFDTQWEVRYKKHSEGVYTEDVIETPLPECHLNAVYGITLEANTEYDLQVRGNNPFTGWTDWSDVLTFTTMCNVVTEFPISYYFEGDECIKLYGSGISLSSFGPTNCLKYDGGNGQSGAAVLNLTQILTAPNGVWVSFDWRYSSENPDYEDGVQLQYANNNYMDDEQWTNAGEFIPRYGTTTGWERKSVFVPGMTWGSYYFRLKFTGAGGGTCYLDNLTIDRTPDCPAITEISKSFDGGTATLTWTSDGLQNEWQVYHSTNGATYMGGVSADDIITVTSPTVTLENLTWGTFVWIRSNCDVSGTGFSAWTRFDLTDGVDPCASVTGLTHSDIFNHNDITVSWTPAAHQTEWQVVYSKDASFSIDDVTEGQIHLVTEPSYTMHLQYEDDYRVWVRGNCLLEGGFSDWEMISFKPTQYAEIVLNEGTETNTMVPVNPVLTNTENLSMSQFILSQASVASCEGKIKGLKFYVDAADAIDFTNASFYVYMRETTQTAFNADEFFDWTAMIYVYGGPLSIEQEGESYVMNINFAAYNYFDYSGQGNLIIGIKQMVQSTDATAPTCSWYGVETTDYASIGKSNNAEITRCQFLPKVQISNREMNVPCPRPTRLKATNVYHNSIVFSWAPGLEETEWMLSYREVLGSTSSNIIVTENPYRLTGLSSNTYYEIDVKASCGGGEYSDASTVYVTTALGNTFNTDGDWNVASNWSFNEVPTIADEVYIAAAVVVPSGCIAEADKINKLSEGSITIADGGQMKSNHPFPGVIEKNITGYGVANVDGNSGYYLISTPFNHLVNMGNVTPKEDGNFLFDQMDLYWLTSYDEGAEWHNPKDSDGTIDGRTMLITQKGYLYARQNDGTLSFGNNLESFPATNENVVVNLSLYTGSTAPLNGWNLIGNPFSCNAYLLGNDNQPLPFYRMNETGDAIVKAVAGTPIKPCEGVLVLCSNDVSSRSAVFTTTAPEQLGDTPDDVSWLLPVHHLIGSQPACFISTTVTQTINLVGGQWNWFSTYIDMSAIDGLTVLETALGDNAQTIMSFDDAAEYFGGGFWFGLDGYTMVAGDMLMIDMLNDCTITLEGPAVDLSTVTYTLQPEAWTWIGFPFGTATDITVALTGFEPEVEDIIQNFSGSVTYFGFGMWFGDFTEFEPGQGYMYYNSSNEEKTLTFQTASKSKRGNP